MGKCKIANILEMASRRAKQSEILDLGSSGTWPTAVSYPNMTMLIIGPYLGNRCPQSENKLNFDSLG